MRRALAFSLAVVALLAIRAGASQPAQTASTTPITYKHVDGHTLSLYITQPSDTTTAHPAVLFFHGGGWTAGTPSSFDTQAAAVAAHGIVGITVEYRLLAIGGTEPPRICVEDARSAMRWVRAHAAEFHIDSTRIAAAGGSAGGYMAAYMASTPGWDDPSDNMAISARPDALILFNPVLDNSATGYANKRFGAEAALRSPLTHVTNTLPPMLIQSGSADALIHAEVLHAYERDLQGHGVECELHIYSGQEHGFFNHEPYLTQTTEEMLTFLRHLGWSSWK